MPDPIPQKTRRIRLKWAGGTHWFEIEPRPVVKGRDQEHELTWLLRHLREGPAKHEPAYLHDREMEIFRRLLGNRWGSEDVAETIRCGLIGGGDLGGKTSAEEHAKAAALVDQHVLSRPLADSVNLASNILAAHCYGVEAAWAAKGVEAGQIPEDAFIKETVANDG